MLDVINETNTEVSALLAGAVKTIQAVRYCWLVTTATMDSTRGRWDACCRRRARTAGSSASSPTAAHARRTSYAASGRSG